MKVPISELAARLNGGDFILDSHKPQLVSIAGNIGVGKTTLANKLSERFICDVLCEPYDDNPFMPDVYAGRKDLALDSQLFFLTRRAEQLNLNNLMPGQIYISDYVFDKEIVYAKALLNEKQLDLYEKIYNPFIGNIFEPVLVIYMKDSGQNCLERIHNRNRPYEQQIEVNFLNELDCDYDELFSNWKKSPVIRITTQQLDYSNDAAIEGLVAQIKYYLTMNCNGSC
jgi:deoxyguanosine kinase